MPILFTTIILNKNITELFDPMDLYVPLEKENLSWHNRRLFSELWANSSKWKDWLFRSCWLYQGSNGGRTNYSDLPFEETIREDKKKVFRYFQITKNGRIRNFAVLVIFEIQIDKIILSWELAKIILGDEKADTIQ